MLIIPLARDPLVTSEYGRRFHPVDKVWRGHDGIDLRANYDSVLAADNGIVDTAHTRNDNGCGIYVGITHGNIRTVYCHLSEAHVAKGDLVSKGMTIGKSGNTGTSSAPHLHFKVQRKVGISWETVNPANYLPGPIPLKSGGYLKGVSKVGWGGVVAVLGISFVVYKHWWG